MSQLLNGGHSRHGKRAQGHTVDVVFVLQDLGAQAGHVDIGRTLAAAAFACEATVKNVGQFLGFQDAFILIQCLGESLAFPSSCEDFAKHVGTSAGGLGFVTTHLVGRAQCAADMVRLTTIASPVALLDAAHQCMKL